MARLGAMYSRRMLVLPRLDLAVDYRRVPDPCLQQLINLAFVVIRLTAPFFALFDRRFSSF